MKKLKNIKLCNIKKVAHWEFVKTIKSPTFLILTFIIPIIMLISGGVGYITERMEHEQPCKIAVIDETGEFYPFLEEQLKGMALTITQYDPKHLSEVESLVMEGEYDGFIIFTEDNIATGHISFYASDARNINQNLLTSELELVLSMYRLKTLGLNPEQIATASIPLIVDIRSLQGDEMNIVDFILPLVTGMILIFAVVFSGQVLMYGVIKEKQNRIVEILLSSISSFELLLGKIIGFGLLSLIQMAIWIFAGIIVAGRFVDLNALQMSVGDFVVPFLFFFFGYFMLSSLFAAVGATMKEAQEGSQLQGLIIMVPMIPLFLAGPIVVNPNALWVRILSHVPPFIPAMVLLRMGRTELPAWEIATTLTTLVLSAFLFISIGARIFEGGIMKYDRAFTFKDLKEILAKK